MDMQIASGMVPVFLSTLSLRRATLSDATEDDEDEISIHALLAESDGEEKKQYVIAWLFLSTLSLRRATPSLVGPARSPRYFYPRSPCGERRVSGVPVVDRVLISIHALLAESDGAIYLCYTHPQYFYPRSPCGERQGDEAEILAAISISIHALLAESDLRVELFWHYAAYFYPRSPCGERLQGTR